MNDMDTITKPEIITFADALARVGLPLLADHNHHSVLIEWTGYPTPFSCGRYDSKQDTAGIPCPVRISRSYVGDGCQLYCWNLMAKSQRLGDHYKIGEAWVVVAKSDDSSEMYLVAGLS